MTIAGGHGLVGAVQFLTRVPVRTRRAPDLTASVPWFPLIGAAIGAAVGAVVVATAELVPMPVAATIGVLFGVLITGAFHEDGLADVADAFAGGWNVEERLRILRDPLHGSYGVAAMQGSILLRVVCVASMGPAVAFAALICAHTTARAGAVAAMRLLPSVRPRGLGADYSRSLSTPAALIGVTTAVAIGGLAIGWWIGPAMVAVAASVTLIGALAISKIGGITGDVLGAIEQLAECLVLVVVTAFAARHPLWWA